MKTISVRPLFPEVPKFLVTDHSHPSDDMMCVSINEGKVKASSEKVGCNVFMRGVMICTEDILLLYYTPSKQGLSVHVP